MLRARTMAILAALGVGSALSCGSGSEGTGELSAGPASEVGGDPSSGDASGPAGTSGDAGVTTGAASTGTDPSGAPTTGPATTDATGEGTSSGALGSTGEGTSTGGTTGEGTSTGDGTTGDGTSTGDGTTGDGTTGDGTTGEPFSPKADVQIYIDNFCQVTVEPESFTVPAGETLQLTYHNNSVDYAADVWLSYGGGFLDLPTGQTWADQFTHCAGPNASKAYADISIQGGPIAACPGFRLWIDCL